MRHGRPWGYALAALALVLVLAAWAWFVWVPGYRPGLHPGERHGIDVSHHQGAIDWERVFADDISFAYLKATEGADHVDSRFQENRIGARRNGIQTGAYHFFTLCRSGLSQAANFLDTAPPMDGDLPPAVDLELAGNCADRPERAMVVEELRSFVERVEDAWGVPVVLYLGADFEEAYGVRAELDRPLWIRRPLRRPSEAEWVVWQLWGYARVDGIEGRVDLDVLRGPINTTR